mgnify:CR=1 FL=1
MITKTTVVIKTIGRATLDRAVQSAKREGFETLVVSDGAKAGGDLDCDRYIELGRRWGYYGGMAANVGAALIETEFITFLDDDDEFAPGAGDVIRRKLRERPEVDVWVGGVRFNQEITINGPVGEPPLLCSRDLCMNGELGIVPGNVCMPTYRTSIFRKIPFTDSVPPDEQPLTDFHHIRACCGEGYHLDWFEHLIYLVRPAAGGVNGEGQ